MVSWLHLCLGVCLVATAVPGGQALFNADLFQDPSTCKDENGAMNHTMCEEGMVCTQVDVVTMFDERALPYGYSCGRKLECRPTNTSCGPGTRHDSSDLTRCIVDPSSSEYILAWLAHNSERTKELANLLMRNLQGECTLPATETVVEALSGLPT